MNTNASDAYRSVLRTNNFTDEHAIKDTVYARETKATSGAIVTQDACRRLGKRLAEWTAVFVDGRKDQHPLAKTDERMGPG